MNRRSAFAACGTLLAVMGLLLLAACRQDCYVSVRSAVGVSFISDSTGKAVNAYMRVQGVGTDSVLYDSVSVSKIFLPLHVNASVTEYQITIYGSKATQVDTTFVLHVEHTPQPQYVSPECGCAMFHQLQSATFVGNQISKQVDVLSTEITNESNALHLQIHR